jgi:hypothetical protein
MDRNNWSRTLILRRVLGSLMTVCLLCSVLMNLGSDGNHRREIEREECDYREKDSYYSPLLLYESFILVGYIIILLL